MSVLVLTTGGTIGALPYDDLCCQPIYKTMPEDGTDIVRVLLEKDFSHYALHFITLKHLDSNFIDEAYRQNVRRLIEEAAEREVLITHGTDTILVTADYFFRQREASPALRDKVILLTGSMIALSCGPESDGFHNIRFSLEQLSRSLPSGVYVVLSDYDDVQAETGWSPRLYRYQPKKFGKTHDVSKMNRDRMFVLTEQE